MEGTISNHTLDPMSLLLSRNPDFSAAEISRERSRRRNKLGFPRRRLTSRDLVLPLIPQQIRIRRNLRLHWPNLYLISAMIRKENRRPANSNLLPRRTELTPPSTKSRNAAVFTGSASSTRGSISASAGEKKNRVMMGISRNSYANAEDLKKISMAAASAINGVGGGRKSIGGGRSILGYRQIY